MTAAPHQTLVLLSSLVILSFLFDHLSRRLRIPAVLFLLGTGMLLRWMADGFRTPLPDLTTLLPLLGMVGLVLIVFEAALDLEIHRGRARLIGTAALCAMVILVATAGTIAWLFHHWTGAPYSQALINAVPLAVISSAVAIPSVVNLDESRREFIVYESTFSDVLGILIFNFLVFRTGGSWVDSAAGLGANIFAVLLFSVISILLLGWMLARSHNGNKLALVLAILVLVFAGGKWAHLPTLLLVFGLGISLNNAHLGKKHLENLGIRLRDLNWEVRFLKRVTSEAAFLVRTYFFVLFGLSISWAAFSGLSSLALGAAVFAVVTAIRALLLWGILGTKVFPEVFIAPRGLITILLFYSIPPESLIPQVSEDVLLVVVLGSTLSMAAALLLHRKPKLAAAESQA